MDSRTPAEVARYKKRFLVQLEKGISPRIAAKLVFISPSAVYGWKNDDPKFAADWDDAIETGIDRVETALVKRAIKNSDSNAQFYLRAHRPETYGRHETSPNVVAAKFHTEPAILSLYPKGDRVDWQCGWLRPRVTAWGRPLTALTYWDSSARRPLRGRPS